MGVKKVVLGGRSYGKVYVAIEDTIQENTKLKAEIEELAKHINNITIENTNLLIEQYRLERLIEQLKSELEQSIKLPCKVGNIVYAYSTYFGVLSYEINSIHVCCGISFEAIASRNDDMLDSIDFDIEDIGKTVFLTQEEAEQSLKVENNESKTNQSIS